MTKAHAKEEKPRPALTFEPKKGAKGEKGDEAAPDGGTPPEPNPDYHKASGAIRWAEDLIRELRASGTGEDKIQLIRLAQARKYNREAVARYGTTRAKEAGEDPECHLSAEEAVLALEADDMVSDITKAKARALLEKGEFHRTPATFAPDPAAHVPPPPDEDPGPVTFTPEDRGVVPHAGEFDPGTSKFPGPKEKGKPGDPGTGERGIDRAGQPGLPASADTAELGKGHEPGLPPASPQPPPEPPDKPKGPGRK